MMKTALVTLMMSVLSVGPSLTHAANQTEITKMGDASAEVQRAVLDILAAEVRGWNAGDAAVFCAAALPDVVFTNVMGMFTVGFRPFEAQHARIFATIYKGSLLKQSLEHITTVTPDVIIVDTVAEVSGYDSLPPGSEPIDGVLKTRLEQVLVLKEGQWRVASFHNVSINPAVMKTTPRQ